MFLLGLSQASRTGSHEDLEQSCAAIPTRFRGFAYEGAAMGLAMLDTITPGRRDRCAKYLHGCGDDHIYMVYIGFGWAMARMPRLPRPRVALDPVLQWLVLDGYGFHQAYFHTRDYVNRAFLPASLPWSPRSASGYAFRVLDQGVGRALWFVGGTDPRVVLDLIEGFPLRRRADLFSGVGLAATYAGGAGESELRQIWAGAGEFRQQVAQGSAFAAEARRRAGLQVPESDVATAVFCDLSADEAAEIAVKTRPSQELAGDVPAYELWRRRVADEFVSLGRC